MQVDEAQKGQRAAEAKRTEAEKQLEVTPNPNHAMDCVAHHTGVTASRPGGLTPKPSTLNQLDVERCSHLVATETIQQWQRLMVEYQHRQRLALFYSFPWPTDAKTAPNPSPPTLQAMRKHLESQSGEGEQLRAEAATARSEASSAQAPPRRNPLLRCTEQQRDHPPFAVPNGGISAPKSVERVSPHR